MLRLFAVLTFAASAAVAQDCEVDSSCALQTQRQLLQASKLQKAEEILPVVAERLEGKKLKLAARTAIVFDNSKSTGKEGWQAEVATAKKLLKKLPSHKNKKTKVVMMGLKQNAPNSLDVVGRSDIDGYLDSCEYGAKPSNDAATLLPKGHGAIPVSKFEQAVCLMQTDMSVVMDYQPSFDVARRNWDEERPTYTNLNRLLARVIASLTANIRFSGVLADAPTTEWTLLFVSEAAPNVLLQPQDLSSLGIAFSMFTPTVCFVTPKMLSVMVDVGIDAAEV